MGITIHYRGSLVDLSRVEDFEDRVIDLALALGGDCRVWRSASEHNPTRIVRGLILDLAPGQESTSLLISPEGWLITIFEIEAAEKGELSEKPWCFVKTQFGSVEGHVAIIELFTALKKEFMPDLEISDEGEYWERHDVGLLQQKMEFLNQAMKSLETALEQTSLSPEAAEDPEIVATRVVRIARIVQQTLRRPAEHPPIQFPQDDETWHFDTHANEALWDELYQENRRKQEQITRLIQEQILQGVDEETAFSSALEQALGQPSEYDESEDENFASEVEENFEPRISEDVESFTTKQRHPLIKRARSFLTSLYNIVDRGETRSSAIDSALQGAMELNGGLVQALSTADEWSNDPDDRGLSLVQLKRALRGAAFVVGSLYVLRVKQTISDDEFVKFKKEVEDIQTEIVGLLKELRQQH